jgi:hypothetical protein
VSSTIIGALGIAAHVAGTSLNPIEDAAPGPEGVAHAHQIAMGDGACVKVLDDKEAGLLLDLVEGPEEPTTV